MFTGVPIEIDLAVLIALLGIAIASGTLVMPGFAMAARNWRSLQLRRGSNAGLYSKLNSPDRSAMFDSFCAARGPRAEGTAQDIIVRAHIEPVGEQKTTDSEAARTAMFNRIEGIFKRSVRRRERETDPSGARCVEGDMVIRLEGDNFVILVRAPSGPSLAVDGASIAKRLRAEISQLRFPGSIGGLGIKASFAFARRRPGEKPQAWQRRAEQGLKTARTRKGSAIIDAEWVAENRLPAPPIPDQLPAPAKAA